MNDVLYNQLITPWMDILQRPVVMRQEMWIYRFQCMMKDDKLCCLFTDLILHSGVPCDRRYCICRYFTVKDKLEFYRYRGRVQF